MRQNFYSAVGKAEIDCAAGVVKGVSVITTGEAIGHDKFVDVTTLNQVCAAGNAFKSGVAVKMDHGTGVGEISGCLRNFRVDGNQCRADLHLLKNGEDYAKILEMCQTMPESFGLSIACSGMDEMVDKVRYVRCQELYSVDLVDQPAANPTGLFSKNSMSNIIFKMLGLPETATESEIMAAFSAKTAPVAPDLTALEAKLTAKLTELAKPAADNSEITKLSEAVTSLLKSQKDTLDLAAKSEKRNLVAEASRFGKVIPLTDDEIYGTDKEPGVSVTMLKSIIAKVQPTMLQRREMKPPTPENKATILAGAWDKASSSMTEYFNRNGINATATN